MGTGRVTLVPSALIAAGSGSQHYVLQTKGSRGPGRLSPRCSPAAKDRAGVDVKGHTEMRKCEREGTGVWILGHSCLKHPELDMGHRPELDMGHHPELDMGHPKGFPSQSREKAEGVPR